MLDGRGQLGLKAAGFTKIQFDHVKLKSGDLAYVETLSFKY